MKHYVDRQSIIFHCASSGSDFTLNCMALLLYCAVWHSYCITSAVCYVFI